MRHIYNVLFLYRSVFVFCSFREFSAAVSAAFIYSCFASSILFTYGHIVWRIKCDCNSYDEKGNKRVNSKRMNKREKERQKIWGKKLIFETREIPRSNATAMHNKISINCTLCNLWVEHSVFASTLARFDPYAKIMTSCWMSFRTKMSESDGKWSFLADSIRLVIRKSPKFSWGMVR